MSERDRGMAIALLAEAFHVKDLTPARIRILDKQLQKVPTALLEPMVERAIATRTPRWGDLPAVAELREDAEYCRRALHAAHPYHGCIECEDQIGWRNVTHPDGVRVERCPCFHRHHAKLAELGVGTEPLSLPPARDLTGDAA